MKELSISYPKKRADEEKLAYWLNKYQDEQARKVNEELERIRYD